MYSVALTSPKCRYANEDGFGAKGLVMSAGEEWREQRRFTLKNLRGRRGDRQDLGVCGTRLSITGLVACF